MPDFTSFEKFDWFWRLSVAQAIIFALFLAGLVSFSLPMADQIRPYFILIIIYHWAIYRPTLLHPIQVFGMGFVLDLILGLTLGLHSILFLLLQWIMSKQRLFLMGQTYLVVWIGFALTCLSFVVFEWLFFSALAGSWLSFGSLFSSCIATILLFPLVSLLFISVQRLLPVAPHTHL